MEPMIAYPPALPSGDRRRVSVRSFLRAAREMWARFGIFSLCLALVCHSAHCEPQSARLEADQQARDALLNLHFFAGGRGLVITPGVMAIQETASRSPFMPVLSRMTRRHNGAITEEGNPVGLFVVSHHEVKAGTIGCASCHAGRAAGRFIPGEGNKNVDVLALGRDLKGLLWLSAVLEKNTPTVRELQESSRRMADLLADKRLSNLTQGLVPASLVFPWFYRVQSIPVPRDMGRGAVKIPALWGYGAKIHSGFFCDGIGRGSGWLVLKDLAAGQMPQTVRGYLPKLEHADKMLADLLPPPYPYAIDSTRVAQGRKIYQQNCQNCHGSPRRDPDGLPVFSAPTWTSIRVVQTDPERLTFNTPQLRRLIATNPLRDIIQTTTHTGGYMATGLEGVWCRFPYLHNASVPSLAALLMPTAQRPKVFDLKDAGEEYRFDQKSVGLTVAPNGSLSERFLSVASASGNRRVYSVTRVGQSNEGHEFGTSLSPPDKAALIEYLKSL